MQDWPLASMPWVLGSGHMGLGGLQKPPSHSTEEVHNHHRETLAPGNSEEGPRAPDSSGPEGAGGHLPLLLLLKLLVGSIQVCEHLQQAGSCLSLPGQGIRTGRWERDTGAQPGQGSFHNPHPVAFSGSRFACTLRILKGTRAHTHSPLGQLVAEKQEWD